MKNDFTFQEMLNQWAIYSKYDKNQTLFNLNSFELSLHDFNKQIEIILEEYDNTGFLALLQAKSIFFQLLKQSKVSVFDILTNISLLEEEKLMMNMFECSTYKEAEKDYLNKVENLCSKVIHKPLLGELNEIKREELIVKETSKVLSNLQKLKLEVYQKGNTLQKISYFYTKIKIFSTLAECLLTLEQSKDGIYLCFIDLNESADSYFGFFIKNNGNLFSLNERCNEDYKGSHLNSRSTRYAETKLYDFFPYDYIFSFSEHDRLGYATKHKIDTNKLDFLKLTESVYLPILIAMNLITYKYEGTDFYNHEVFYLDTLLPNNLDLLEETKTYELLDITKSNLIVNHKSLNLEFDTNKVLDGSYGREFATYERFSNRNQLFVDLWGKDFKIDFKSIYQIERLKVITDKSNEKNSSDFVGNEKRIRMQGYYEIRKQLASYIRQNILEEYKKIGGISFIKKWYINALTKQQEKIYKLCVRRYLSIQNGMESNLDVSWSTTDKSILTDICYQKETSYPKNTFGIIVLNDKMAINKFACPVTNKTCSHFFIIKPKNWKSLEDLLEVEVPKIIKGWDFNNHKTGGNSILFATDAVDAVGTPFEEDEESRNFHYKQERTYFNFKFAIGFSKRGLNQLIKQQKEEKI